MGKVKKGKVVYAIIVTIASEEIMIANADRKIDARRQEEEEPGRKVTMPVSDQRF
jgi:hypothetical protein